MARYASRLIAIDLPTRHGTPAQFANTQPGSTKLIRCSDSIIAPSVLAPSPMKRFETQPTSGSRNAATVAAISPGETRIFESDMNRICPLLLRAAATRRSTFGFGVPPPPPMTTEKLDPEKRA